MLVASTGRREIQRSAYAIIRSFMVLCDDINSKTKVADGIKSLIDNADAHIAKKNKLKEAMGEDAFNAAVNDAKKYISVEGHYKKERVDGVVDELVEAAEKNKVDNVRQRAEGVHSTAVAEGLILFSKLRKDLHLDDLVTELKHRGFVEWVHPIDHEKKAGVALTFTELKKKLGAMEEARVIEESPGVPSAVARAKKAFKALSVAEFKMPTV